MHIASTDTTTASAHDYRAGSLTYSKKGLLILSLWLLWGDFAFQFFESIFARFMPIFLKELNASNTMIGIMTGSFAGLVNVLFLPMISQWCDNLRTPIGRRIPLLYVFAPLTVATLIGVGFAPEMGLWLHARVGGLLPASMTPGTVTLGLLCVLVVGFHFFNMVLVNGYNWLVRDVVPLNVMSRFLAWFSIVGAVSGTLFLWFVFPHLLEHRQVIFLSVGVFYIVAFFLMCTKVKEGEYPPPMRQAERTGIAKTFIIYFRECLQIRLYRHFFLACLLMIAATTGANNFITLFARESLGLDMGQLGHVFAWTSAVSVVFFYPTGWLCDRSSPMHVALGAIILIIVSQLLAYLFVGGWLGFFIYSVAYALPAVAWGLSQRASSMKLFPTEKFGQFSSGLNVFGCGALIVSNFLTGLLMDVLRSDYRLAFLWAVVVALASIPSMLIVLREWNRHGGRENYVAPLPV